MEEIRQVLMHKCPKVCYCIKEGDETVTTLVRSVLSEYTIPKAKHMLLVIEASITL